MLKVCTYSREAETFIRRKFAMRRPTANRDQAIILTLLDSGIRASEFCSLRVGDFEAKRGKLEIRHGTEGGAKGGKGRVVYLGKTTRHALWRYLAEREDGEQAAAPLFVVRRGRPFNPSALRHLIKSIASRPEVKDAYPHKFRHTFAITYLRSGGDIFTLQSLLGHGSLDMVRHYALPMPRRAQMVNTLCRQSSRYGNRFGLPVHLRNPTSHTDTQPAEAPVAPLAQYANHRPHSRSAPHRARRSLAGSRSAATTRLRHQPVRHPD